MVYPAGAAASALIAAQAGGFNEPRRANLDQEDSDRHAPEYHLDPQCWHSASRSWV
ncbi:MAG: hypothetical protein JWO88_3871 [Frankiales bacterium]|nr:hypothetical protein [Frankiales bacterium]